MLSSRRAVRGPSGPPMGHTNALQRLAPTSKFRSARNTGTKMTFGLANLTAPEGRFVYVALGVT